MLASESTFLAICSSEPTTYDEAATAFLLGFKAYPSGGAFGAPEAAAPNGRKVVATQITDGTITTSGTASWWAAFSPGILHARGDFGGAVSVTEGFSFALAPFAVSIPSG